MPRRAVLTAAVAFGLLAASPAQAAVEAADLRAVVDTSLHGLIGRHLPWGGFDDPLAGPRFNYGAVGLAWLAGDRAVAGPAGDAQRAAAASTLRTAARTGAPGAFQIWLEALALTAPDGAWLDAETRTALSAHLQAFMDPVVGPRAQRCRAKPRCYNNLKLVDAVASLQLTRTGLRSLAPGTRLADPAATERAARAFLARQVPAAQHANLRIRAGALDVRDAAVLSDPSRNPLAYHALSTAMLVRAVRLLGPDAPARAVRAARRALWALVALADPHGTVAWMGRGQENTWTYAAATYAALGGAANFKHDAALADRLRRLAALSFAVVRSRLGNVGLAVLPGSARVSLAGADRSQDTIACNGLALTFIHLAAAEAGAAAGATAPLPSEVAGSTVLDPTAAGVATARGKNTWLAVHRTATHPQDARYDAGLLAAQVWLGDRWVPVVGQRPNTADGPRAPAAGPMLVRTGRLLAPSGRIEVSPGAVTVRGAWRGTGRPVAAVWRFAATAAGVALRSPCPRGARVRIVEWVPEDAAVRVNRRGLVLDERTLTFSIPVRVTRLRTVHASAAHERLVGQRLEARCRGHELRVEWRTTASSETA